MRRRMMRVAATVAAAAVTLTAAGCTAIPNSGPVEVGLPALEQSEQLTHFTASGPTAGATQEDVVRGFVLAAVSSTDDYATAREFLSREYQAQWDPYAGVLIDSGAREYHGDDKGAGTLSLSATAKIDAQGSMLPVAPGEATNLRFEFTQEDGEWRIASAPNGIILDTALFSTIWSKHDVYFVGAGHALVPEPHWFLTRAALPTEAINTLLAGPTERMRGVLHTGFPTGTTLASNAVPVREGRATIDLTGGVLDASAEALAELSQQVRFTLQSVQGISAHDLQVDGTNLRLPPGSESDGPQPISASSLTAVVGADGFGTISSGEFTPQHLLGAAIESVNPRAISLAPGGESAAVLSESGVQLVTDFGALPLDDRAGLLDPEYDRFGYVWTLPRKSPTNARVSTGDTSSELSIEWLEGRQPVALRVSADGSRVAVLVRDSGRSAVLVAGVVRDPETGAPTATTPAETQLWASGAPLDIGWVGQQGFAVLSQTDNGSKVTVGGVGVLPSDQGVVPGGVKISSGSKRAQLHVLSDAGDLYVPQGSSGWQRTAADIDILAK